MPVNARVAIADAILSSSPLVPLHGFEVTDSTPVIHLLHERIPDSRHQLRPPLVLPLLKLDRSWHLESIEELTPDLSLGGIEPGQANLVSS